MSGASEAPAIPEDVREAAARAASMIKRYPLTEAGIAGLIEGIAMKARAARPVDTGREKALEEAVRHLQDHFPGAAMEFDVIYARALANPENGRG